MTTTTAPTDPAQAYELVRDLIFDQVHKFRRRFGGDVDELVGEANLAFMKGHTQYMEGSRPSGEEHGEYHTEIRRWVWFELFDAMRTRLARKSRVEIQAAGDHAYGFEDTTFDAVVWAADMGDDAREAVGLVLDPPLCVAYRAARKGGEPRNIRSTVREHLKKLGWSTRRINDAFDEIREALG